jgi:hypothetical protein
MLREEHFMTGIQPATITCDITADVNKDEIVPEIQVSLDTLGIHPSLRHPSDPCLFKTHEGYVTVDYVTRKCAAVECTYSLWNGTRKNGQYVPAPPVIYEQVSREEAFTKLVYALNTGDETINKWRRAYSDIRTREVSNDF